MGSPLYCKEAVFRQPETSHLDEPDHAPRLKDKPTQQYVSRIGTRLLKLSSLGRELSFRVLDTPYVQATSSFIDDEINITRGMLNSIDNEAELACLLGHEIGHQALGHSERQFKDKGGSADSILEKVSPIDLTQDRYDIAESQFHKDQETEADEFGATLAARAGYDPYAFVDLFRRLAKDLDQGILERIRKLKGTHESLLGRANHLEKFLAQKGLNRSTGVLAPAPYRTSLTGLQKSSSNFQEKLTPSEKEVLSEIAGYQLELESHLKSKQSLPIQRFLDLTTRISELAKKYEISDQVFSSYNTSSFSFMEEKLLQRVPLWHSFQSQLSHGLSHLLVTLARVGVGFIPVVGSTVDLYELFTGKDILTGQPMTPAERALSALGVLIGQGANLRRAGHQIIQTSNQLRISSDVLSAVRAAEEIVNSAGKNISNLRKTVGLLRKHNIPLTNRREVIEAFTQNSQVSKIGSDTTVYRYWVEGFNDARGRWVTKKLLENPQVQLALPHGGPYKVRKWTLPAGTEIIEGLAAPNFKLPGGSEQIFLPNPGVLK